ncbi:tobH protein [Tomitella fengzijianii]|uniref:TobH protein n=1 Tax=Tomitella fengzijianii TaxID=2597660 RepID=A0A516X1A0_9ACTN|nr:tobH protein [Tomitella fengzijianii]QDQ96797.1 tobH protein [Tomitella fengzijianii]
MIASASGIDLDDAEQLIRGDHRGILRSAASGGAQFRAVATAVSEDVLVPVAGVRPRAVVLVARGGGGAAAADVAAAVLGPDLDVPVVRAAALPEWAGSLDLVVVLGDDAGDPALSGAVGEAVRRGAETVVTVPAEGPVGAAAGTRALTLPPRVPVLIAHRFLHHLAAALAVLATARPERCARWLGTRDVAAGLTALADRLDGEALTDGPGREAFRNPAKALAEAMLGHDVVFAGDDAATAALARCASTDLLSTAGAASAGVGLVEVLAAPPVADGPGGADSIFHDDQIDGPAAVAPRRVFVFAAARDERAVRPRMAAVPDGQLLLAASDPSASDHAESDPAASDLSTGGPPGAADAGRAGTARAADSVPLIEQCAVLAVRWQTAAGYVAAASGTAAWGGPQGELR